MRPEAMDGVPDDRANGHRRLKVGELAKRTGVSVRTLHHYDEIGLLRPLHRTPTGHRLYGAEDVARLQQVRSPRQLGQSRLREQIELQRQLYERLEGLGRWLDARGDSNHARGAPLAELVKTVEMMSMVENYYTPEQLEWLKQRRETVGEERIREVEAEWPRLIAEVRAEMERGTDPADERVQALARRWTGLVGEFTGGNPEIAKSVRRMYEDQAPVAQQMGVDHELMAYVEKANQAGKSSE